MLRPPYHHPFPALLMWTCCDFDEEEGLLDRLLSAHMASIREAAKHQSKLLATPPVAESSHAFIRSFDESLRAQAAAWPDQYAQRLLYGFLTILYGELEAMLIGFATEVAEVAGLALSKKQKGRIDNSEGARSFLIDTLGLSVPSGCELEAIEELRHVRNAIVHRSGRPKAGDELAHLTVDGHGKLLVDEAMCRKYLKDVGAFVAALREGNESAFVS